MTLPSQLDRLPILRTAPTFPLCLASLLVALAAVACSGGTDATVAALPTTDPPPATQTALPNPTSTPQPSPPATGEAPSPTKQPFVSLPDDEGAHLTPIEWWYFNGLLTDDTGADYSFHYVTFQSVLPNGFTPRLLQLSWADHGKEVYLTDERPELPLLKATKGSFAFQVSEWSMAGDGTAYSMAFNTGQYSLRLQSVSNKPATLHQGKGLVDLGRAGESYYYSRTRLATTGTLTISEEQRQVTGIAWMDHQWGDFSTAPVGWDWMSLQLDDGSDLMISMVWDSTDHQPINSYGTYVPPNGQPRNVSGEDISLTATGSWTSTVTGTTFPVGWKLEVGSLDISLTVTPVLLDSEFQGSKFVPPAYWEGAVKVNGTQNGQSVRGNGFAELVGYDTREFEFPNLGESNK
jgi:predicted secreted hydrolase